MRCRFSFPCGGAISRIYYYCVFYHIRIILYSTAVYRVIWFYTIWMYAMSCFFYFISKSCREIAVFHCWNRGILLRRKPGNKHAHPVHACTIWCPAVIPRAIPIHYYIFSSRDKLVAGNSIRTESDRLRKCSEKIYPIRDAFSPEHNTTIYILIDILIKSL